MTIWVWTTGMPTDWRPTILSPTEPIELFGDGIQLFKNWKLDGHDRQDRHLEAGILADWIEENCPDSPQRTRCLTFLRMLFAGQWNTKTLLEPKEN